MKELLKSICPERLKRAVHAFRNPSSSAQSIPAESAEQILTRAYQRIGILNYLTPEVSGEHFLIHSILPSLIECKTPVMFDVGANAGNYTKQLAGIFPEACIHSFEPSSETYDVLVKNTNGTAAICVNKGLSDEARIADFFDYENVAGSEHATLHAEVFSSLHSATNIKRMKVELTTIDRYCQKHGLTKIDFLKIDTEGHELPVIKGSSDILSKGGLPIIQFEFNEMNIMSRVFLKDFYEVLEGYRFFRLMPTGILPLGPYQSRNEVFAFQNILALHHQLGDSALLSKFLVDPLKESPLV